MHSDTNLPDKGRLYGNLTIEDLHRDDYQSSARNKLIVEAFYLTGDIEKYGTGYNRIRNAVKEYPTMQFKFQEANNGFLTELSYEEQKISTKIVNVTENVTENPVDKVTENRLQQILSIIKSSPRITTSQLANILDVTRMTIHRDLENLKSQNKLHRIGGDKGGIWEATFTENVTENVTENLVDNITENRLQQILSIIKSSPRVTTSQLAKSLQVTRMTIHRDLDILKSQNKLRRIGGNKGGLWEIINAKE